MHSQEDVVMQDMVSSVAETQQSSEFAATQAANQQLQEQLTQQQQACEAAHADEKAKEQAFRYNAIMLAATSF